MGTAPLRTERLSSVLLKQHNSSVEYHTHHYRTFTTLISGKGHTCQGPHPPTAHSVNTPAIWQTLQECESKDNPQAIRLLNP